MLIPNDFYTSKNPNLAPNLKGPAKIIDINNTDTTGKLRSKVKVLNIEKSKLFYMEMRVKQTLNSNNQILMMCPLMAN